MGACSLPAPRWPVGHAAAKVLVPPAPPRLIGRRRIARHPGWTTGVTVLSAGPGAGKTLAARQHAMDVAARGVPVAWLSVDRHDDHPDRFWPQVIAALRRPLPAFGDRSIDAAPSTARGRGRQAATGWGDDAPVHDTGDRVAIDLLLRDLEELDRPTLIVLDDVHHLHDRALIEQLSRVIEHRSPHLHLVMTMRARSALPFPWWRRDGRVGQLRAPDLRFTADEGETYLRHVADLALDERERSALVTKLDGWPAMVSLAALALRGRQDARAFVDDQLRCDRLAIDHLVGDAVERLPADDQHLLFSLSVLDHVDGALAVELTGDDEAGAHLRRLEHDGLFVVALDPQRTTFRIHRLVSELLQHELRWRGDEVLDDLHRRAALALIQRGRSDEAVIHLVQAGEAPTPPCARGEVDDERIPLVGVAISGAPAGPSVLRSCETTPADALSEREAMLLDLLPTHLNYREIAAELYVSINTVKTQLKSVYRKLGASSRTEAVQAARRRGLLA